jgi:phosphoglycolate phosphatase-like HAD superfamily hydrolase
MSRPFDHPDLITGPYTTAGRSPADLVLGPEAVLHPKPAPDMLLTALERLKLTPNEVLYVGDMTVDIQTARAAGVHVWVVPTGSDERAALEAAHPDRVLRDLYELVEVLPAGPTKS